MLHAPTSETKQQSDAARNQFEPELQLELHPRFATSVGRFGAFGAGGALSLASPSVQRRKQIAGWQATHGNQAVLRMLNREGHAHSTAPAGKVAGVLHRKCACGGSGGECAECKAKREGALQRAVAQPRSVETVPPIVHEVLRSPGQRLDPATHAFMEAHFGSDFSHVRLHTDTRAAESARVIGALAYTVGRDIVFGSKQYQPETVAGRRLLAHELTHVVQQEGHSPTSTSLRLGPCDSPHEQQAHAAAEAVNVGYAVALSSLSARPAFVQPQCGGRPVPGCVPGLPYISYPSNPAIGVAVGQWIGLQYISSKPTLSYVLVDWWLYGSSGPMGTIFNLLNIDPAVTLALLAAPGWVTRFLRRTDILDSDTDDVYEVKPRRGAGAGPAQLGGYLRSLMTFAPLAPAWMGSRRRIWTGGLWNPSPYFLLVPGTIPGLQTCLVCVWSDPTTMGVLIYDIVCCPNYAAITALVAALGIDRLMDYLRRLGQWMREHAKEIATVVGVATALVLAVALIVLFWAEIAAAAAALAAAVAAGFAALVALFAVAAEALAAAAPLAAAILVIAILMKEAQEQGEQPGPAREA